MMSSAPEARRVIAYVDGFNLYFGLKKAGFRRCYWLNLRALLEHYLHPGQKLAAVKYFTARIAGPPEKKSRQDCYLDALKTLPDLTVIEGQYRTKDIRCRVCSAPFQVPTEKMTDVNIATELLTDAFRDQFDTAFVVSGDSDLVPPIRKIRELFSRKPVLVLFPPHRVTTSLKEAASGSLRLYERELRSSQFPDVIDRPGAGPLTRPPYWA